MTTTPESTEALLPCPFCGGMNIHARTGKDEFEHERFEVSCFDCGAAIGWAVDAQPWGDDLEAKKIDAIAAWNRRPAPPTAEAVGVQVKALEWVKHPSADLWRATTLVGQYDVSGIVSPAIWQFKPWDNGPWTDGEAADPKAAMARAQADYEARIRSALSATPGEVVAPEGWTLVPVEPTEEMLAAGWANCKGAGNVGGVFAAMLAASPPAPASKEVEDLRAAFNEQLGRAVYAEADLARKDAALQEIAKHPESSNDASLSAGAYSIGWAFWNVQRIARRALSGGKIQPADSAPVAVWIEREVLDALQKYKDATGQVCSGLLKKPFGDKVPLYTALAAAPAAGGASNHPPARPELDALVANAKIAWENLEPDQQEELLRAQRASWVRGEMGIGLDPKSATPAPEALKYQLVEVGQTPRGYTLFRERNEVGGHRYWSDEIGGGVCVWDTSLAGIETLEACIAIERGGQPKPSDDKIVQAAREEVARAYEERDAGQSYFADNIRAGHMDGDPEVRAAILGARAAAKLIRGGE